MRGMPPELRRQGWIRCSEAPAFAARTSLRYHEMVVCSMAASAGTLAANQIEKDLLRTFPNNVFFTDKDSEGIQRFGRVGAPRSANPTNNTHLPHPCDLDSPTPGCGICCAPWPGSDQKSAIARAWAWWLVGCCSLWRSTKPSGPSWPLSIGACPRVGPACGMPPLAVLGRSPQALSLFSLLPLS